MKALVISLLCLTLISCHHLKDGLVKEKAFHPAYEQVMFMPMIIPSGKSTTTILVPYFVHKNESWSIVIGGNDDKGKYIEEEFYIDNKQYDTLSIGSYVCVKGMCDEDTSIHKTRQ